MLNNKATLIVINSNIKYIFIKSRNDKSDLVSYELSEPDCTSFALQMLSIPQTLNFPSFSLSCGLNYDDSDDSANNYYCQHVLSVFRVPDTTLSTLHALFELKLRLFKEDLLLSPCYR